MSDWFVANVILPVGLMTGSLACVSVGLLLLRLIGVL
jgi:hypothetical protein